MIKAIVRPMSNSNKYPYPLVAEIDPSKNDNQVTGCIKKLLSVSERMWVVSSTKYPINHSPGLLDQSLCLPNLYFFALLSSVLNILLFSQHWSDMFKVLPWPWKTTELNHHPHSFYSWRFVQIKKLIEETTLFTSSSFWHWQLQIDSTQMLNS